ncbi:MAG: hypothetical protein JOZ72_11520 [Alphaproteobacteria bacterium]|nr:hypothetical protein [Alphaproteobacteria bacterium]
MFINARCRALAAATGLLLAAGTAVAQPPASAGGFAIVNADGSLGPSRDVVTVFHVGTGIYRVQFDNDVSGCAANATLAAHTGRSTVLPGYVVAARNDNAPNQVRIYTFSTVNLVPADFKFNLVATC